MSFNAKAVVIVVGVAGLIAGNASAADISNPGGINVPSYDAPAPFKWDGAYVGVHGGATTSHANPLSGDKALLGGIHAGYNFQTGPAVLGVEVEGSYLGNAEHGVPGGKVQEHYRGAAKARAGISLDHTLVYGTAGLTMTNLKGGGGTYVSDGFKQGYLLGAGVEQAFGGGLSASFEYDYVATDDMKATTSSGISRTNVKDHVFKAGLNYRF
ncbi:outer membrane protein [Pleomorphomonas sp. PLEO]|uniref:outer membrane protein n=1 Tax=Pleomorphomonas sp. PLEO TaxID=3239306 RepID=UPI00351E6963